MIKATSIKARLKNHAKENDTIRYDMETLEVINITEFKEYHGV